MSPTVRRRILVTLLITKWKRFHNGFDAEEEQKFQLKKCLNNY